MALIVTLVVLCVLATLVFVFSLCRAAALGDRMLRELDALGAWHADGLDGGA